MPSEQVDMEEELPEEQAKVKRHLAAERKKQQESVKRKREVGGCAYVCSLCAGGWIEMLELDWKCDRVMDKSLSNVRWFIAGSRPEGAAGEGAGAAEGARRERRGTTFMLCYPSLCDTCIQTHPHYRPARVIAPTVGLGS
jgi:hypothetical protein